MKWMLKLLACWCLLWACESPKPSVTKDELIKEKVEERVATIMRTKRERCQEDAMQKASRLVDSMIIAQVKAAKDTIEKPPKPNKPDRPIVKRLKDSTLVAPFLSDTIGR